MPQEHSDSEYYARNGREHNETAGSDQRFPLRSSPRWDTRGSGALNFTFSLQVKLWARGSRG